MGAALQLDNRESWLEERSKGIGASEVATILGLNPYESPRELYHRKRGEIPSKDETLAMWLGHEMEPIISKRYEMETGRALEDPGEYAILPHPDYPWLRATLDRKTVFADGREGPVELKAPMGGYFDKDGVWCPPDGHMETWLQHVAPLGYQAQLQIQMACGVYECGEIVALIGNAEFIILPYERHDEFLDAVIPEIHEFWERVQAGDPPPVDSSDSCSRALRLLHPLDNGKTVSWPAEFARKIQEWEDLKAMHKGVEEKLKRAKNELIAAIGDNTFGEADGLKVSYKAQTRKAYEVTETTYRVLRKVGK